MRTLVLLIAMPGVTCGCDQFDEAFLLAGLVRGGCTLSPDTSLFVVIDRAVTAESSKLPRR